MLKTSIQLILVVITIFVINQSCGKSSSGGGGDDNTVIESDKGDGSEGASLEIDGDVLSEDEADISEGSSIANDVTGAYLDLPAGISQASNPINVASDKKLTAEQLAQLTLSIPLKDSAGAAIPPEAYERILVMYHVKLPDESLAVGYIPNGQLAIEGGSASLNLQAAGVFVKFTLRGFGVYQAALLPEGSTQPAAEVTKPTTVPIPVIKATQNRLKVATADVFVPEEGAIISDGAVIAGGGDVYDLKSAAVWAAMGSGSGLAHDPTKGIKLTGTGGSKNSQCFDSGSDTTTYTGIKVYSDKPISGRIPDNGDKTTFGSADIDGAGAIFLSHLDSVAPKDTSGSGQTITKFGAPTETQGQSDKAILFNGSSGGDDYFKTNLKAKGASSAVVASKSTPFTVLVWAKPTSSTPGHVFGSDDSGDHLWLEQHIPGSIDWRFSFGNTAVNVAPSNNGQWNHLALSSDGTTLTPYLDGVAKTTQTTTVDPSALPIYIGALNQNGSVASEFDGSVDELAFFNKKLSTGQIQALRKHGMRSAQVGLYTYSTSDCSGSDLGGKTGIPSGLTSPTTLSMSGVKGRYYNYTISLAAESASDTPHISKIEIQKGFTANAGYITTANGIAFTTVTRFDVAPPTTTATFQLSADDGATWMYWNGTAWATAPTNDQANTFGDINANLTTFGAGGGNLKVKGIIAAPDSTITDIIVDVN
jgi:hypothetical protein